MDKDVVYQNVGCKPVRGRESAQTIQDQSIECPVDKQTVLQGESGTFPGTVCLVVPAGLVEPLPARMDRLASAIEALAAQSEGPRKPYYSVKEVAAILGRSEQTVRRWIREGKLASSKSSDAQQGQHLIPYASLFRS